MPIGRAKRKAARDHRAAAGDEHAPAEEGAGAGDGMESHGEGFRECGDADRNSVITLGHWEARDEAFVEDARNVEERHGGLAQLPIFPLQRLQPRPLLAGQPSALAPVTLGLPHPLPERLGRTLDLPRHRAHRRPLRGVSRAHAALPDSVHRPLRLYGSTLSDVGARGNPARFISTRAPRFSRAPRCAPAYIGRGPRPNRGRGALRASTRRERRPSRQRGGSRRRRRAWR